MDLTSVDAPEEIVGRHYAESLFFGREMPECGPDSSLLDYGSGAGFPGLPLAILNQHCRVTLLEANQRRAVFLKEAARGLTNVSVVAERGEKFAGTHDIVVARAVNIPEVVSSVPRLGNRIGLLLGESAVHGLPSDKGIQWGRPVRIPWSEARCCIFGECST